MKKATFGCTGQEGAPGDQEPTDGDDFACFDASASLLVQVSGCNGTNAPGFDGSSYQADWPDGNTSLHPTALLPLQFLVFGGHGTTTTRFDDFQQVLPNNPCPRQEVSPSGAPPDGMAAAPRRGSHAVGGP